MIEIKKIQIALANLDSLLNYVIQQSEQLSQLYKQLLQDYNAVCNERDMLKDEILSLKNKINKLKEDGKHNIDDLKS